ncbi:MAG TPA: Gfo/Idh/MocA family oxidoreductase [Candidatus Hydrogenedentes bacterium]|nr:Gfo/Idh/MocA family oxidoreductase [Candidatus Hydrogenedentota bacterium]HPG66891.1 Gfo/Idh/MocA family oxidoreductase [Candidatus Hydrogenedentota bacterium]
MERNEPNTETKRSGPGEAARKAMGRRDFLLGTATVGAGVMLGRKVLAQEDVAEAEPTIPAAAASSGNPADQLNIAMIGLGAEGMVLMDAILRIPDIRVKAVCDIWEYSLRRGARTLKKFGHEVNSYVDYQEMLEAENDLDAVVVATPDFMHAEHAIACMNKGLHVYCEKEMSNDLEKARQMVVAAKTTGKLLQIGHQRRSNPRYRHAINRLVLDQKLLGEVTHAYGQWNRAKSDDLGWPKDYEIDQATLEKYGYASMSHFRNWRWYKKYGGGPIVDLGSHQIDIFTWIFGNNPRSVTAGGGIDFYQHHEWYDNVMAIFDYETEAGVSRAFYQVLTTTSNGGFYENFMGTDGTLVISEVPMRGNHLLKEAHADIGTWNQAVKAGWLEKEATPAAPAATDDVVVDVRVSAALGSWPLPLEIAKPVHQPHLENFFNAIRFGEELNCPAEIGYETAVAVLKVNEAVETGQRIMFKPGEFEA